MASLQQIAAAATVSEQEVELHRILNPPPLMLGVMGPDGRISWVNDVALDYLGIRLEDIGSLAVLPLMAVNVKETPLLNQTLRFRSILSVD